MFCVYLKISAVVWCNILCICQGYIKFANYVVQVFYILNDIPSPICSISYQERYVKITTMIIDLSVSHYRSVSFSFIYSEAILRA